LTKQEAISGYGKLSNFVHQTIKTYSELQPDFREMYQYTKELTFKICNLLSHHQITVIDENKTYRVLMQSSADGAIQVVECKRLYQV